MTFSPVTALAKAFRHVVVLAFLAANGPALAEQRIRTVTYDVNKVVRVPGRIGIETSISFGPDEQIENIAVGDSLAWQVNANKRANLLFIKPVQSDAATNMTVVTNKRVYLFDLEPQKESETALYTLRFRYPDATPAKSVSRQSSEPLRELNFSWQMKGDRDLYPTHCYDDGRSVYLKFAADQPMPAILVAAEDGSEGPANYTVRGSTIVVGSMPAQLVLRSGRDKATLTSFLAPPGKTPSKSSKATKSGRP